MQFTIVLRAMKLGLQTGSQRQLTSISVQGATVINNSQKSFLGKMI